MLATGKAAPATQRSTAAMQDRVISWIRSGLLVDVMAVVGVMAVALAARLPYLQTAPRFRDETFNARHSLKIYRGEHFPFTDHEAYIGAFFNYAVAAGMFVVGPTIYAARQVVTWFGVMTVGATYLLGRELGGPASGTAVGLIAAAFMTTNGIHIAPVGHVSFSGSITPFFTTLAFWLLHRWRVRRTEKTLVWAGFMLGMSMHTHPTIVAFLPGVAGWVLWRNLAIVRTRWPYLAALAFLVAFSPMIVFNILNGGESIRHAIYTATERPDYARGESTALTLASYVERQHGYWVMLHGTLGGAVDERESTFEYLTDPWLVATSLLAVAGLVWAARRHRYTLPLWLGGSFALGLPIFNANHYGVEYDGRYVLPLLPMVYAAIGVLVVDLWRTVVRKLERPAARTGVTVVVSAVVLVLAAVPLLSLGRYYNRASRADPTNNSLVRAVNDIKRSLRPGDVVLLDNNLNDRLTIYAADRDEASTFRVIRYIMEFDRVPYVVADVDDAVLAAYAASGQAAVVVLSSGVDGKETARLGEMLERFGMTELDGKPPKAPRPADRYGLFRLEPAQAVGRP